MKILTKLIVGFGAVVVILAIVGGIGWYGIGTTEKGLAAISEESLPAVEGLSLMMEAMNAIKSAERTMVISSITAKDRAHEINNLKKRWAMFEKGQKLFHDLPRTAEEEKRWQEVQGAIEL